MKKIFSVLLILVVSSVSLFAKISFGESDLNSSDEVLFTVKQDFVGISHYKSLFYAKLVNGSPENKPELITTYPEQMELLQNGTVLQIRNRYSTGSYNTKTEKYSQNWICDGIPSNTLPLFPYSVSPDGKWICHVEKESLSYGILVIEEAATGKTAVLCDSVLCSYDSVPVKWSPDSSILVYEKNSAVYFCNPQAVLSKVEMDEKYRKIGRGSINSVCWASERYLVYIDDYLVYQINSKELYTLGLYSGIIGQGKAIGRLPSQFNCQSDKFSVNPSVSSFVVIQNNRLFTYLKLQNDRLSCDYMDVVYSKPYTDSTASLVDSYVFWDKSDSPILWLEKLPYNGNKETGSVYKLGTASVQVLEIADSGKPFISPDGGKVAFFAGAAIYIYDINTWLRVAELTGENIVSALWVNRNVLFVGGEKTIRKWNLISNTYETILLSSAQAGYWDTADGSIIAATGSGNYYKYNAEKCSWRKITEHNEKPSTQNGKYRVFNGTTPNQRFENALYIRTLTKKAVTKPMYKESTVKTTPGIKIALVFDAYDNADGLPKILSVLQKYNVKGTFFMNGEFIRRYPSEVQQIVANGYEAGSMFFSTTDLVNNPFVVDEEFVRRGLARNEDEFFQCTGKEMSLYWHAPYYSSSDQIISYGDKAGYTYINSVHLENDCEKLDKNVKPEYLIQEYCKTLKLCKGGIVPVAVGFSQGNRADPLYNYLDQLVCALVDSGFEFCAVEEL